MKLKVKYIECESDRELLTLRSGGGGGKSSTSMLAAILLHKLFSQQHEGDELRRHTFLKEKDKHRKLGGFMNERLSGSILAKRDSPYIIN